MGLGSSPLVALEAHGVGKRYRRGRPWALRDVTFTVPIGTITALVGPNGSGKSTLIRACIGFEHLTAGCLLVDGVNPRRDRGGAIRRVGYVPQAASLYGELSIADHLAMARSYRPAFDTALAARRLDELAIALEVRADELSGGQQAQVALAIALGTRAPVLLLDEPLASLDPLARREFLHVLVDAVRSSGSTALLSSHVITDIEQSCDRLLVLGGGRKLLDLSIVEACATHRVVPEDASGDGRVVGRFPGPGNESLALVEDSAVTGGREATLEEVVLGHLAAGRVTNSVASPSASVAP